MYNMIRHVPGKGRGVFAGKTYLAWDVIEECHCIHIGYKDTMQIHDTILGKYLLGTGYGSCIVLGNGSLYNHDNDPNTWWRNDGLTVTFYAIKDITQGDELTISYGIDSSILKDLHGIE